MFPSTKIHATFLVLLLITASAWAQTDPPERSFNLSTTAPDTILELDEEELLTGATGPAIEAGKLELSLTLGFLDLDQILLAHPQIIYKYTAEETFWGDVSLHGQSAFNPIFRLNYNLTTWLALEPMFNFSVSEYRATIENRHWKENLNPDDPQVFDDPELLEFDPERRSLITLGIGIDAMIYPLNLDGNGEGRFHPFVIGGVARTWFDPNSAYTDGAAKTWTYSGGGGFRYIMDDLISVRFEMQYCTNTVHFTPSTVFDRQDEGATLVYLYEFPHGTTQGEPVEDFETRTINSLSWGLGFPASF